MLKRTFFTAIIIACAVQTSFAQENLQREVLFTLGTNEIVNYGEYYVYQQFNKNQFACILKDTVTKKLTFIFNGERVAKMDYCYDEISYLNVNEKNGYICKYPYNGEWFCNIKGIKYGGYKNLNLLFDDKKGYAFDYTKIEDGSISYYVNINGTVEGAFDYASCYEDSTGFAYHYMLAGKMFDNKNGKSKKSKGIFSFYKDGTYDTYVCINGIISKGYHHVYDLILNANGKYAYSFYENGEEFVNINGGISKGYDGVWDLTYKDNGKYAYLFKENNKYFANINGEISKGYDNVWDLTYKNNGKYAYSFSEDRDFANINGVISKYDAYSISDLQYFENGKYAYLFRDNGKWYANINGVISKGYDDDVWDLTYNDNGKYAYLFKENNKGFANINGIVSNGYNDGVGYLTFDENGKYKYYFYENRNVYENNNGKITKTKYHYNNDYYHWFALLHDNRMGKWENHKFIKYIGNEIELYASDKERTFYSNYEYEYVLIDYKKLGKSPALRAWYDEEKNAFIWNSIEDKELVVYEYKLD